VATQVQPPVWRSPPEGRPASGWIISRREDVTWFIGSAAISYLALGLMALGFPIMPIYFVWLLGVDGPHILSTVTRTYFDKAERTKLGATLWVPLPLFFLGPLMAYTGQASLFFLFAVCWQHLHIVKQHFGFVMLYKAKNGERDSKDFILDKWFLLSSLFVPLALFIVKTRPALRAIVAVESAGAAALAGYALLCCAWCWRQVQKHASGAGMNWPKIGLLLTVVPLQWLAFMQAADHGPNGILRAAITLGLFHSFQYHRLMWFHNKNRYREPGAEERNGFAAQLASSAFIYLAVAIGLHFVFMFLPTVFFPGETVMAAVWGFSFGHYILDARIWHVRSDKELAAALQLA